MAYAQALQALGDPTRRSVLEELRQGPRAVGEIAARLPVSRPAVSQHLRVLKEAGLVTERQDGTRRLYRVDPDGLAGLRDYLDGFWEEALASFKAARTLSRDPVTSFLREPFVEGHAGAVADEEPVRTGGLDQAIGELVTCTRCVGTWAAAGLAATQIVAPRFGRMLTWSLGAAAANDFLQAAFTALTAKANELEPY